MCFQRSHLNTADRVFLHQVNHSRPMPLVEETFSYHNEAFSEYDYSTSPFYGKQGVYTKKEESPPSSSVNLPSVTFNKSLREPRRNYLALRPNGRPVNRFNKTVTFRDYVVVRECDEEGEGYMETTFTTEAEVCTDLDEMNMDCESVDDNYITEEFTRTISYCEDINESEMLNTHLKRINRDYEIPNTDHTEVKTDLEDIIHANPLELRHQKIAGKHRFKSDLDRIQTDLTESQERDPTQAEFSIFKEEPYIINPKVLISEANKPIKYSENFKSDGIRKSGDLGLDPQASAVESSVQKFQDASNQDTATPKILNTVSTLPLDSSQYNGSEQCLAAETNSIASLNMYYVNEDIATNLDDSSLEEESVSNLDTSGQHLNYVHDPHDMQIECFNEQLNNDESNDGR